MQQTTDQPPVCDECGKTKRDVQARHLIGGSGPGWTQLLCDLCAALPTDPDVLPAAANEALARRARRPRT